MRRIDFENSVEAALHEKVVSLVRQLNDLISKRELAQNKSDIVLFERSIDAAERLLKDAMNSLYEVGTDLEEVARP